MDEETKKNTSEMRKKGIALASAALIGATTAAFTSSSINKYKENAVDETTKVVTGTTGDDLYDDYQEPKPLYLNADRFIKTYEDEDYGEYLRVFQASSPSLKYGANNKYEFNTPEYSTPLYVPREDTTLYLSIEVKVDNPSAECSNFRMTPEFTSSNIIRKIPKDTKVYLKPGPVTKSDELSWYEALYNDNGDIIKGYFCEINEEQDKKYFDFTLDKYSYSYIEDVTRLYTTDEVCNMYYEVSNEQGIPFTSTPGNYDDALFLPYGSIIKGTPNTDVKKTSFEDNYAWMQCTVDENGESKVGYIPFRTRGNEFVTRVPIDQLEKEPIRKK